MKLFSYAFFIIAFGLLLVSCCESAEVDSQSEITPADSVLPQDNTGATGESQSRLPTMPVQSSLGAEARETLGYLLFVQAIFDEDEAELLEAAQLLSQNDVPPEVWQDGGIWLVSRKSPNAVPYLEEARKALPDDLSLLLLYAEALGDHDLTPKAVELVREYLQKHPDSLDARIELALLLVKDQKFLEAQKLLNEISPKQRTDLVDYYQARALIGMGKGAEAIPYLRKALRGMPDFVEALAELAFLYEQTGNLKEARNTYERLQKLNFSPQEVALRLIGLSLRLKQPEKALQYYRQGPDNLQFQLMAANLFRDSRHFLQAENILKQAVKSPDAPVEVYLILADLDFDQRKKLSSALNWLDKIPPEIADFYKSGILRAQLLAEAGKTDEAISVTEKNIHDNPQIPEFADLQIRLLVKDKKLPEALQAAKTALEKWPDNSDMTFLLGSILDESGDKKEAMSVMEKLIESQPDHFQALNYVGFTLAEENRDIDRALSLLGRANELAPNQAFILDSLAWALYRANRLDEALKQIKLAVQEPDATDPAIWEHYGDIASKMSKKEEARRAYRKALELKPDNAAAVRAKMIKL